jgi:hypothetical protein
MTYQITLTPEEYTALSAVAAEQGKTIDALVHAALVERFHVAANGVTAAEPNAKRPMTEQEFLERLYRKGIIANIPTRQPLTHEERAERERLARSVRPGKMASEIVIEDRGPR